MPSRKSQGILRLLRNHKKFVSAVSRDVLMRINPPAGLVARLRICRTVGHPLEGLDEAAIWVKPIKDGSMKGVILHLHGGAYVSGGLMQCRQFISPLCSAANLPALTFAYRLAPEHSYPAQLEDAIRAYRYLLEAGYRPEEIVLAGESAGGNLAIALTMHLINRGDKPPAALALFSPWVDLAQAGESYVSLREKDATLDPEELMQCAVDFAGSAHRLTDPEISPVYGKFSGFPPVQIHCGDQEILLSDSVKLEEAMARDGVQVQLIRWAGMCHVFQMFGFDESRASYQAMSSFIKRILTPDA